MCKLFIRVIYYFQKCGYNSTLIRNNTDIEVENWIDCDVVKQVIVERLVDVLLYCLTCKEVKTNFDATVPRSGYSA